MRNVGHPSLFIFTYGKISSSVSKYKASPLRANLSRTRFSNFHPLRSTPFFFFFFPRETKLTFASYLLERFSISPEYSSLHS